MPKKEILVIDDDDSVVWVIGKALAPFGYDIVSGKDIATGLPALKADNQVVLLDLVLPDGNGLDALKEIKKRSPELPVIIVSAHGRMQSTIDAMKLGAYDYIEKPFDIDEIVILVERAWKDMKIREELKMLKTERSASEAPCMVGKSKKMVKVFKDVGRVALKDVTLLITGESGTGKELIARAIHYNSNRKAGPFVAINSAAIPRELLESELFGWKKGAFTGAHDSRPGSIASASGGTLFLDELADMDINLQAKLLRFMQDKVYTPLGGGESIKADVRIIGATNKNLKDSVEKGLFREDLYYRFNVVELPLPSLRERKEDILPLTEYFLSTATRKYETGHKELSPGAKELLAGYHWPGNVRELENVIKRAVILSGGSVIERKDLLISEGGGYSIQDFLEDKLQEYLKHLSVLTSANLYDTIISEVEKALITIVMRETGNNQLKAAKTLGINRNTLRAKIKRYGLS